MFAPKITVLGFTALGGWFVFVVFFKLWVQSFFVRSQLLFNFRTYATKLLSAVVILTVAIAFWGVYRISPSLPAQPDISSQSAPCVEFSPCSLAADSSPYTVLAGGSVVLAADDDRIISMSISSRSGVQHMPPRIAAGILYAEVLPIGSYDLVLVFESGRNVARRLEVLPVSISSTSRPQILLEP